MMVKNESKHLEKCLKSLQPIMNIIKSELIIVDTGSEDNTVEIAKKFTDKVYYHEWINDFSAMRNITISYAKGEWIFIIDGDEIVDNPNDIISFLKWSKNKNYSAASVIIKSFKRENDDKVYDEIPILRLFKNKKCFKFEGKIHEQPRITGPIYFISTRLLHYGYITTDKKLMERKFKRNIEILKNEIEKDPKNIYYWYQLSAAYGMHSDFKESLDSIIKAYQIAKENNIDLRKRMYVYTHLAVAYFWNKKYKELEQICKEAIQIRDCYMDLYFLLGIAQRELKKYEESIKSFKKYLKMVNQYNKHPIFKDFSVANLTLSKYEEAYMNLCIIYEKLENYKELLNYANKIDRTDILNQILPNIINAFLKLEEYRQLKEFYNRRILVSDSLKDSFLNALESIKLNFEETVQERITKLFNDVPGEYGILNRVRFKILEDKSVTGELLKQIKKLDLNELPYYYGDIIYYFLLNNISISHIYSNLKYRKIEQFINYISIKYKDVHNIVLDYVKEYNSKIELSRIRINKVLYKFLLTSEKLEDIEYSLILDKYINEGTYYIKEIYSEKVIENEMIYDIKDEEDAFLIYLYLANQTKSTDQLKYVKYLRKALKTYPKMKKVIEVLLDKVKDGKITKQADKLKEKELERYKTIVKDKIKEHVNKGELVQAKDLIEEYENLVKDDVDIYSVKSVIAMIENRLDDAEKILEEAFILDSENFDILYNKAYLHKLKGEIKTAYELYQRILEITDDEQIRKEIENELSCLSDKIVVRHNNMKKMDNLLSQNTNEEFERCKRQLKDRIKELIREKKLEESKLLIAEYEKIVSNDLEILMFKSQIALLET